MAIRKDVNRLLNHNLAKPLLFFLASLPFFYLVIGLIRNSLGPDPAEYLLHFSGAWALNLIFITLTVSPLRSLLKLNYLIRFRRMLGLYAFFYTSLHFLVFLLFFLGFNFSELITELRQRPYISVGFAAWLLLLPLTITSTLNWRRRLGAKWQQLHRLIYMVGGLCMIHIWWQVRSDWGDAALYTAGFLLLMIPRLSDFWVYSKSKKSL